MALLAKGCNWGDGEEDGQLWKYSSSSGGSMEGSQGPPADIWTLEMMPLSTMMAPYDARANLSQPRRRYLQPRAEIPDQILDVGSVGRWWPLLRHRPAGQPWHRCSAHPGGPTACLPPTARTGSYFSVRGKPRTSGRRQPEHFLSHPRKRRCTRRAQSSACSTQAETGVPEWGGQGHGVRGKRKKRLRAPGRGRARKDLESGLGSEFREAQPDTCMFEEEKRRPRQGEPYASFSGGPDRGGLVARDLPVCHW
ncbi:hypothetical protein MDA_GLEAN10011842 [Myotis davidii]|uniref:Uncharacterized protein n=1 Tax=Myotis davidii TaxID=225400 RepID=L5LVI7_MYODS|nr:hypothetical protein MDA_GLEAN10011842 [Myotis davidii]